MFTGLIEQLGRVAAVVPAGTGDGAGAGGGGRGEAGGVVRLEIDPRGWGHVPSPGASIAVNGCCLTVANDPGVIGATLWFDAVPQTLRMTTIGALRPGDLVHLEHAATPSTLLGGHVVQGHVDGVASVVDVSGGSGEWRVRLRPPTASAGGEDLMEYLAPRGSVCVQGVSLTVAAIDAANRTFDLALIPTTLEKTTLGSLKVGDGVNMECDAIAKSVVHWLRHYAGRGGG